MKDLLKRYIQLRPTIIMLEDLAILYNERTGFLAIGMDGKDVDYAQVIKDADELEYIVREELLYEKNKG